MAAYYAYLQIPYYLSGLFLVLEARRNTLRIFMPRTEKQRKINPVIFITQIL